MGCRMDDVLAGIKTRWILLYISIRSLGWPDALSVRSHEERNLFIWAVGLRCVVKVLRKPCCKQTCCYPGFVVLLMEHVQSRFSPILKGPRILRIVVEAWLYPEVSPALASNKRVNLCFETLKQSIDFSSLAMKVLYGIFSQCKTVSSMLKTCCLV